MVPTPSTTSCGINSLANEEDSSNLIVGGNEARPNQFPWQAFIKIKLIDDKTTFCGGSVITNKHVLTAAHCTEKNVSM